jgi:uncharacterized RDD family membrane protein YckC
MTTIEAVENKADSLAGVQTHYAGFWMRLCAYIIDYVFMTCLAFVGGVVVGILYGLIAVAAGSKGDSGVSGLLGAAVGLFVLVFYNIHFVSGRWQATPGKRILGLHIIRINGEPMTGGLAVGRALAYMLSSMTLFIGFMMIGWTNQKKGLHDIICGTRVVYGKL